MTWKKVIFHCRDLSNGWVGVVEGEALTSSGLRLECRCCAVKGGPGAGHRRLGAGTTGFHQQG